MNVTFLALTLTFCFHWLLLMVLFFLDRIIASFFLFFFIAFFYIFVFFSLYFHYLGFESKNFGVLEIKISFSIDKRFCKKTRI